MQAKRNIFRINSDKPTAVNLEHVTMISVEENRITFSFFSNAVFIDLESKEVAEILFEKLLLLWAGDLED